MATRKARRRISVFYVIYFLLVLAAAAFIIVACYYVRDLLAEYEAAQPKYTAERVFETYFSPINYDKLLTDARYDAGLAGSETIVDYLTAQIDGEALSWSMGSSVDSDTLRYIVKAGAKQIGSFYLTAAGTTTEHGFSTYRLDRIELPLNPALLPGGVLTFTAPADYTVTLDGVALTAEQVTSTYTDPDALKYYPAGMSGVEFAVYTVPGFQTLPQEVTVTDPAGNAAPVTLDQAANSYTAGITYNAALAAEYGPFVTEAVEGYAAYMQRVPGSGFQKIRGYFDPDSDLYTAIRAAANDLWMVKEPSGNDFLDVTVGEFYAFPEDIFSCRISFTQMLYRNGEGHPDAIDMTVFLHKTDEGYRIYEWYNNS